jgi:DNA-directed RNA polymerase subunit RPC12/RpoP
MNNLNEKEFQECLDLYLKSDGRTPFWDELAEKFGYKSGELIRGSFKRERKRRQIPSRKDNFKLAIKNAPKILIFDIETSPLVSYTWGLWKQDIPPDRIINDYFIISWSAKWVFSDKVMSDVLTSDEAVQKNDERIVKSLYELINKADVLISHNGKQFDIPRSNSRFLYYRLNPPNKSLVIDTLEIAKRNFGFTSNSLDYICHFLELDGKKNTDFSLWVRCIQGDSKALKEMNDYNKNDVQILEDVYMVIRPWIRPHPNFGLWGDGDGSCCPNCGSKNVVEQGYYYTQVSKFLSYRCSDCGALSRAKQNVLDKEYKKTLLQ